MRSFFRHVKNVFWEALKGFWRDECLTKGSTLSFYTLQSIIPFLAFLLGIARGFGFDETLEGMITESFQEQKEVIGQALQLALGLLNQSQRGVVVGFGLIYLIFAASFLMDSIESTFNQIWKIDKERSFFKKVNEYIAILVVCPLMIVFASSLSLYVKSEVEFINEQQMMTALSSNLLLLFKIASWFFSWLFFFFLYYLIPNARLKVWTTAVGALFAGTLFHLFQIWLFGSITHIFSYNTIYGTFAVLPLFFLWLQFSWLIALLGAEISACLENGVPYATKRIGENTILFNGKKFGLLILYKCLEGFYKGEMPITDIKLAEDLRAPLGQVQKFLKIFVDGKILCRVETKKKFSSYQLYSDPHHFSFMQISNLIAESRDVSIKVKTSEETAKVSEYVNEMEQAFEASKDNLPLSALVET